MPTISIAGWRLRIDCSSLIVDEAVAATYRDFVVTDCVVNDASLSLFLDPDLLTGEWLARPVIRKGDVCQLRVPGAQGSIDLSCWQAILRLGHQGFQQNLEHFLKLLFAYVALYRGGLLFHSAGILADRGVYLFTGESGSGKSTVVSLSPHMQALNDDLVVLAPGRQGWRAYGTPFWNVATTHRSGQTASGEVVGIYRLAQNEQDYLEPISNAVAVSELMANSPNVNTDPMELPALMTRCREVAEAVGIQRLHFRKSASFWTLLHARSTL